MSLIETDKQVLCQLYQTLIVDIDKETKRLKMRTGGWYTKHTKKCINLVLNKYDLNLIQEKFKWNLYRNGTLLGTFQNDTLEVDL